MIQLLIKKNQNKYKLIKSLANIDTYDLIIPLVNHKIFVQKFYNNLLKIKNVIMIHLIILINIKR